MHHGLKHKHALPTDRGLPADPKSTTGIRASTRNLTPIR